MKRSTILSFALVFTYISLLACASCSDSSLAQVQQNSDRRSSSSNSTPTNSYSNALSNAGSATNSTSAIPTGNTAVAETPIIPLPAPIEGGYSIARTDQEGTSSTGTLKVDKQGGSYIFTWNSDGKSFTGSGVNIGNTVVVSFTKEKNGNGCGAALYKVAANGNLEGKIVYWGSNKIETEQLFPFVSDEFLNARYSKDGTQQGPDKENDVTISYDEKKDAYHFIWSRFEDRQGWGIRIGNMIAAPFGENHCAYGVYTVEPDGTFIGKYSDQLGNDAGTETAKRK
jgi:hypothetical protein